MPDKNIDALIQLLDDPDEGVYGHIRDRLLEYGQDVIPTLEDAWEQSSFGILFQSRVEDIIHSIQYGAVYDGLREWARNDSDDLLAGVLLIARYQYPDLDEEKLNTQIDKIQQDIWMELNYNLTAFEQVKIFNHILFDVHGFSGNTSNYHAPQNSYINNVLETKKGNPLSLSILYSILAQRLSIPIYGINLPRHFILAYLDSMSIAAGKTIAESEVLFYINPFSRGGVFSKREIDYFLEQLKLEPDEKYFRPCYNIEIVSRIFNNLIHSYEKLGYPDKVSELQHLAKALIIEE